MDNSQGLKSKKKEYGLKYFFSIIFEDGWFITFSFSFTLYLIQAGMPSRWDKQILDIRHQTFYIQIKLWGSDKRVLIGKRENFMYALFAPNYSVIKPLEIW